MAKWMADLRLRRPVPRADQPEGTVGIDAGLWHVIRGWCYKREDDDIAAHGVPQICTRKEGKTQ